MGHVESHPSEQKLAAVWDLAGDAMLFLDPEGVLDCNGAAQRLFGIDSREHAIGMPLHAFAPPTQADSRSSAEVFADGMRKVIASGAGRFDWEFRRPDGSTLVLDVILHALQMGGGRIAHGIFRDVTAQRAAARQLELDRLAAEGRLRHLSRHDALTGLANRSLFLEEGQQRLDAADRPDRVCLLCLDIDNFSRLNEALGHAAGDDALCAVGERLRSFVGPADLLARLGNDEFALLLADCGADAVAAIAGRLVAEQERPLSIGGQRFNVTVSVGIACACAPERSVESLMQQAAVARGVARRSGRGGWQIFAETMNAGMRDRWQLECELRTALQREQFVLHYQPQVDLSSNRITGVEALLRWQNPRLGLLAPNRFIGLAEDAGLIEPIGEWVLFEACRQGRRWLADGLAPVRMSVNVAARQFQRQSLTRLVERALDEAHLPPEGLELEMTESTFMEGSTDTIGILADLRDRGVSLAIDDFGTGYSSLSYLKHFPLDRLKMDRSFVRDIDRDPDDLAIARTVINLGHVLRLHVIAEGVETVAQLDLLRQHGCDEAQGYHFARALPVADIEILLGRPALH